MRLKEKQSGRKPQLDWNLKRKASNKKNSFELVALSFMSPDVDRRSRKQTRDRPWQRRIADQENASIGDHLWNPQCQWLGQLRHAIFLGTRERPNLKFSFGSTAGPHTASIHVYESEVLQKPRFWPQAVNDRGIEELRKKKFLAVHFQDAFLQQRATAYSQQTRNYIEGCALGFWCTWSEKNARSRSQADIYTRLGAVDNGG